MLLSNGALIISGIPDNTVIKCAKFKGTTKDEFIDRKEFKGMLYEVVEQIIGFLKTHLSNKGTFGAIQRVDKYEIPIEALREAVVNAIVHRDYSIESDIKIAIYDDIVEIISPGVLPKTITLEEIKEGISEIRNKVIARIFKEINFIEQWGSGISRIINACKISGLQMPLFEETSGFFRVVFYRNSVIESIGTTGGKETKPAANPKTTGGNTEELLNKTETQKAEIINYLVEHGKIDNAKTQVLIKVKKSRAREILNAMVLNKKLKKCGSGKNTYYILDI